MNFGHGIQRGGVRQVIPEAVLPRDRRESLCFTAPSAPSACGPRDGFAVPFGAVSPPRRPLAWSVGPTVPRYSTLRGGFAVVRETPEASLVIAGNRRFPACSQNAPRSDDSAGRRPASSQNPADSGNITRELRSLKRPRQFFPTFLSWAATAGRRRSVQKVGVSRRLSRRHRVRPRPRGWPGPCSPSSGRRFRGAGA